MRDAVVGQSDAGRVPSVSQPRWVILDPKHSLICQQPTVSKSVICALALIFSGLGDQKGASWERATCLGGCTQTKFDAL